MKVWIPKLHPYQRRIFDLSLPIRIWYGRRRESPSVIKMQSKKQPKPVKQSLIFFSELPRKGIRQ